MKGGTKKIVFEFLSIVVAVVLAMGLSEWRQEILNEKQARKSFQSILQEVGNNYINLRSDSLDMVNLIDLVDLWLEMDEAGRDTLDTFEYELNLLSKSAWEVAKLNTSLTHIDPDDLQAVSLVYEYHDIYSVTGREVFQVMTQYAKLSKGSPERVGSMREIKLNLILIFNSMTGYLESSRRLLETNKVIIPSSDSSTE